MVALRHSILDNFITRRHCLLVKYRHFPVFSPFFDFFSTMHNPFYALKFTCFRISIFQIFCINKQSFSRKIQKITNYLSLCFHTKNRDFSAKKSRFINLDLQKIYITQNPVRKCQKRSAPHCAMPVMVMQQMLKYTVMGSQKNGAQQ